MGRRWEPGLDSILRAMEKDFGEGVAALMCICKKKKSSWQLEKGLQRGREGAGKAIWRPQKNGEGLGHGGGSADGE